MQRTSPLIKIDNPRPCLSSAAWEWLSYKPSLTQKLREFTANQITFKLCYEAWGETNNQTAWIRKIQWLLKNVCWIEADLIIPETSINSETECLLSTKERPIGELLFQEPSLTRTDFEFFQPADFNKKFPVWIRQSTFYFKQQPLTLQETFFPAFFESVQVPTC